MIYTTTKILFIVFTIASNCFGFDDSIENGWKGIKLLRTDMTTVEKILGKPVALRDRYYNYESDGFYFNIKYSNASCVENNYEEGYYDVPPGTVVSYKVTLLKDLELKDLKFQREKYKRRIDSEQNKLIYYTNENDSIMISVSLVNGIEYIGQIRFDPTLADRKKFGCKKTNIEKQKSRCLFDEEINAILPISSPQLPIESDSNLVRLLLQAV